MFHESFNFKVIKGYVQQFYDMETLKQLSKIWHVRNITGPKLLSGTERYLNISISKFVQMYKLV